MEETFENHELSKQTVENPMKSAKNGINLNKCSQCDYASIKKGHLRAHVKAHIGEKSNKCNQCDYETAYQSINQYLFLATTPRDFLSKKGL